MKKKIIIAAAVILVATASYLVWPRYEEPELSPHIYKYEDAVEFAHSLDLKSTVSEEFTDETIDGHVYRTWPAVIHGTECRIAAVPEERQALSPVLFLSGVFKKDFYRFETDYDYVAISEALKNYPELGKLITDEFDSYVIAEATTDELSDEKFKELNAAYDEILRKVPRTKTFTVHILAGDTEINLMPGL